MGKRGHVFLKHSSPSLLTQVGVGGGQYKYKFVIVSLKALKWTLNMTLFCLYKYFIALIYVSGHL